MYYLKDSEFVDVASSYASWTTESLLKYQTYVAIQSSLQAFLETGTQL